MSKTKEQVCENCGCNAFKMKAYDLYCCKCGSVVHHYNGGMIAVSENRSQLTEKVDIKC